MSVHRADGATYDSSGRLLRDTPMSVANREGFLYINSDSDAITNGSKRITLADDDSVANIEARADGVYNDDSFRFSAQSLFAGRDLRIGAAADFVKTINPSGFSEHSTALLPHIPFNDSGTQQLHTAISDDLADTIVFSGAVSEQSATTISQALAITTDQFIMSIKYQTGTIAATETIVHTIYQGTDNTGSIMERMRIPASEFAAGVTVEVDVESSIGFSEMHANIFIEMVSDAAFSLKTDASGDILLTLSSQPADILGVFTENLVYNNEFDHILDNDLNPVYVQQF